MIRRFFVVLAALAPVALGAGCERVVASRGLAHRLETFQVEVVSVSTQRPPDKTGASEAKALDLPLLPVDMEVRVTAFDEQGKPLTTFERPVSFRVTPGRVIDVRVGGKSTGDRMLRMENGVAAGTVVVDKTFGQTFLWAQDAPPMPVYEAPIVDDSPLPDAGTPFDAGSADGRDEAGRTFATGISQAVYFARPTLADVQRILPQIQPPTTPGGSERRTYDNRSSPLVGNFLTIDAPPPRGDMVVTSITAEGFFVTDLLAPKSSEAAIPGTFGHSFVYNYSYPDGLFLGDRVSSLTGTVQEFSGSTQLVFPSWVRVEGNPRPQDIPAPALLDFSKKDGLGFKLCKVTQGRPTGLDLLCGYSNNNAAIESYESALMKLGNARPSTSFETCDKNGNTIIPFFRYLVPDKPDKSGPDFDNAYFGCDDSGADTADCECNRDCVTSQGAHAGKICSEQTNLRTYGQWVVLLDEASRTRINVQTRDALPEFDPRTFGELAEDGKTLKYKDCTVDIVGMLRQVQAARPRWLVMARDERDVCVRCPSGTAPPPKIPACPGATQ